MLVIMSVIWCGEDMTKKFLYKHAGIFGCEKKDYAVTHSLNWGICSSYRKRGVIL